MIEWKHRLDAQWAALRFGDLKVITKDNQHLYEVQVYLNGLAPTEVRVELYADGAAGGAPVQEAIEAASRLALRHPRLGVLVVTSADLLHRGWIAAP